MTEESRKVKVGVIGVGALGRHHARLYKLVENAEIVGVFDLDSAAAKKVGEEFDIPIFNSMDDLIAKCEALSIAVPATHHFKVSESILKSGKHLLIEKPLADSVEDARAMVDLAKENGLVLGVGHVERFNPAIKYIEGEASKTRFIEAHRLAGYPPSRPGLHPRGTEVGVVLDLMIHDLDIILNLVDSEVERIDAVGIPVLSNSEDIANARIKFKNGCVANVTASRISDEPRRRFRVFQTDAYVTLDSAKQSGMIYKKGPLGIVRKPIPLNESNALEEELQDFINCVAATIETGKVVKTKVCGDQGLAALKLAQTVKEELEGYNHRYGVFETK